MSITSMFGRPERTRIEPHDPRIAAFLSGYSIEVMPRNAGQISDFAPLLPQGTRIYIAHIDGTSIDDMIATARRLHEQGYQVMPHFPARLIPDAGILADWIARYQGEADVRQGLILAGGLAEPRGAFSSSMDLLDTGLFDRAGFTRLHVAGHPEGSRDIDPDGSDRAVSAAVQWKQAFSDRTDADMALVTQFAFDADPVIAWADRLKREGITLPIHVGLAGPAKLQTLIKFAIACGVGPSLSVLQRRAADVTRLVRPFEPTGVIAALARHKAAHPGSLITQAHLFPLGGIAAAAQWARQHSASADVPG